MTAYVIGNGQSRKSINLHKLNGAIYGCNKLYTEIKPLVLVATDDPISTHIQRSGYAKTNRFYTRKAYANTGALKLKSKFANWSSGPNALQIAIEDGHEDIVIIGFDFGSKTNRINNVYANTTFYDGETCYSGNWHFQIESVIKHSPKVSFTIVIGNYTNINEEIFSKYENVKILNDIEFNYINN